MSQPISTTQTELFTVETVTGYGALKRKDRVFVQALFEGCTQREAARRAGHLGSDEVVDACASRAVRSAKVQSVMNQAWARSGASIDDTLRQAAELQRLAYNEAVHSENRAQREEAFKRWRDVSALIASIHGRLQLRVLPTGLSSTKEEVLLTVPESALPVLAQMRRDTDIDRSRN